MSADIAVTRRRKMLAFLVEQGGSAPLAEANQYSETRLLAAHQAFSAIMEGLVDGGFATWDGTTFVVTVAGKEEAALAPKPRARKGAKGAEPAAEASSPRAPLKAAGAADRGGEPAATPPHALAAPVVAVEAVAPAPPLAAAEPAREDTRDHGHSHDHDDAHDHGHTHDHGGDREHDAPPREAAPRPTVAPPRRGLRARALGWIRGLLRSR